MTKRDFLAQLRRGLAQLPSEEREERLAFYSEMIDDRMEEGLSEQEAVASIGTPEAVIAQILADAGTRPQQPRRGMTAGGILLLVLGSPLWLPLLIAALAVVWSVGISLWAVFGSLAACALGFTVGGIFIAVFGHVLIGIGLVAGGLVCAGVGIALFIGCYWATRGILWLSRQLIRGIGNLFGNREEGQ